MGQCMRQYQLSRLAVSPPLCALQITKDSWLKVRSLAELPVGIVRSLTSTGALDAGAHGVLVPLLYTVEDAKKLVISAKFPPQGQRGFGSPFPMPSFHHSLSSADYLQQANDALLTIVQIETKEGLENVEEIANVPGIDVLFVGPFGIHPFLILNSYGFREARGCETCFVRCLESQQDMSCTLLRGVESFPTKIVSLS